jgi:hypothetical protein
MHLCPKKTTIFCSKKKKEGTGLEKGSDLQNIPLQSIGKTKKLSKEGVGERKAKNPWNLFVVQKRIVETLGSDLKHFLLEKEESTIALIPC